MKEQSQESLIECHVELLEGVSRSINLMCLNNHVESAYILGKVYQRLEQLIENTKNSTHDKDIRHG